MVPFVVAASQPLDEPAGRAVSAGAAIAPQLSIGLTTYSADAPESWEPLLARARAADAAGIDRLVVSDHVVFGEHLEAYARPELGGSEGGRQPTGPDGHWLEPLVVLSVLTGCTTRIRLGTNILLAALRRPVVLAKQAATLDVLCGGRLDLGVGVGWQREEYDAAGLDFGARGELLDHTLAVCQTLWRETRADFADDRLQFAAIHQMPKPTRPDGVPVWVSGTVNARVARRVARFGAGWIPWGPAAADVVTGIVQMRAALEQLGRDPSSLQVVGTLRTVKDEHGRPDIARTMHGVAALVDAGVTDVRTHFPVPNDADAAGEVLEELTTGFRAVTR